jgi:isocitrate dehydrogenase (NAD+)
MILSGVLMLEHLQEEKAARALENAVKAVIAEGRYVTYDFKPDPKDPQAVGTQEMADAIIQKLK